MEDENQEQMRDVPEEFRGDLYDETSEQVRVDEDNGDPRDDDDNDDDDHKHDSDSDAPSDVELTPDDYASAARVLEDGRVLCPLPSVLRVYHDASWTNHVMASSRSSTSAINRLRVLCGRQEQKLRETHQARCAAGLLLLAVFRGLGLGAIGGRLTELRVAEKLSSDRRRQRSSQQRKQILMGRVSALRDTHRHHYYRTRRRPRTRVTMTLN